MAQREEIAQLRGTLKSLDRERDELEKQVDEKTEDVVSLEANRIQLVNFLFIDLFIHLFQNTTASTTDIKNKTKQKTLSLSIFPVLPV